MQKTKKLLSVILSLLMIISTTTALPFTAHALASSGSCGENVTYTFDESTGLLTISGTGAMKDYTAEDYNLSPFYNNSSIKTLKINSGVTSIGEHAFYYCRGLTSVTIPDSVTVIGTAAFTYCTSLTSIIIPDSVNRMGAAFGGTAYYNNGANWNNGVLYIGNHLIKAKDSISGVYTIKDGTKTIADYAFSYCKGLTSITMPNSVTSIGSNAFNGCTSLTSVTTGNSVTSIGYGAFYYCTGLTSVTMPDSVTSIGNWAFSYCEGLTSITIPNSVTKIGNGTFDGCASLTSITIPDSVLSIGRAAFSGCKSLISLRIGNGVTSIGGNAFSGCSGLTSITIPNSVKSIDYEAFRDCTSLIIVTIGNSVSSIGQSAFKGCTGLTSVNISSIESWCGIDFYIDESNPFCFARNLYINGNLVDNLIIPDSVTSIGDYAFYKCTGLTRIVIPKSVTSIGRCAFYECTGLTDVYYTGCETEWNALSIDSGNDDLIKATIHYYYNPSHTHLPKPTIRENVIDATCVSDGSYDNVVFCSICENEIFRETVIVRALGHNYKAVVTAPTCISQGYTTYTCTRCDNSYVDNYLSDENAHNWDDGRIINDATCTQTGMKKCVCILCGITKNETIPAYGHVKNKQTTPATPGMNGSVVTRCSNCNTEISRSVIYCPQKVTLSAMKYNYDGKEKKPSVKVTDSNGKVIPASNYSVTYASGRKAVGRYSVKLDFKGNYSGSITKTFDIVPKATSLKSAKSVKKKAIQLVWNKVAGVLGYEIQLATDKSFKKEIKSYTAESKYTKGNINNLKGGKKYYVRIRTFKTVKYGGKSVKIYSSWSKAKTAKTKK